jgi:hypothetical protein
LDEFVDGCGSARDGGAQAAEQDRAARWTAGTALGSVFAAHRVPWFCH